MQPLERGLRSELTAWTNKVQADWDAVVRSSKSINPAGSPSLWDGMPLVDSKTVTETAPIFEKHLGIPLDFTLIRPGGYQSAKDMIDDLVPKMLALAQRAPSEKLEKVEVNA